MNSSPLRRLVPPILLAVGLVAALSFTMAFPEVEGLGGRVRLPVFHGALTWVNLGGFALLGIVALAFIVGQKAALYRWLEALRWSAIGLWIAGSSIGFVAALRTWDFTGSQSSPLQVAMADPRMVAQFWVVLLGLAVLVLPTLLDDWRHLAIGDAGFAAVTWAIILHAVLGPGRALHPDSPVLNSEEIFIKLMFFGIVAGLAVAFAGVVAWIAMSRRSSPADEVAERDFAA